MLIEEAVDIGQHVDVVGDLVADAGRDDEAVLDAGAGKRRGHAAQLVDAPAVFLVARQANSPPNPGKNAVLWSQEADSLPR